MVGPVKHISEYIVYESPDGGETVYARQAGGAQRTLYSVSDDARDRVEQLRQNQLWHDIRLAAQTNSTLQAALDQCIMIYKLSETHTDGL
jgi:hypothetical protein